jgi:hypothetical protein
MAMRELQDEGGRFWRIWEVHPGKAFPPALERRSTPRVRSTLQEGWLVFECELTNDRRRIVPPPPQWSELPDEELLRMLEHATSVGPRRPLE